MHSPPRTASPPHFATVYNKLTGGGGAGVCPSECPAYLAPTLCMFGLLCCLFLHPPLTSVKFLGWAHAGHNNGLPLELCLSSFYFAYFFHTVSHFCPGLLLDHDSSTSTSHVTGITGMYYHTWLFKWSLFVFFLLFSVLYLYWEYIVTFTNIPTIYVLYPPQMRSFLFW
jgi:hypothetical protein